MSRILKIDSDLIKKGDPKYGHIFKQIEEQTGECFNGASFRSCTQKMMGIAKDCKPGDDVIYIYSIDPNKPLKNAEVGGYLRVVYVPKDKYEIYAVCTGKTYRRQ